MPGPIRLDAPATPSITEAGHYFNNFISLKTSIFQGNPGIPAFVSRFLPYSQ